MITPVAEAGLSIITGDAPRPRSQEAGTPIWVNSHTPAHAAAICTDLGDRPERR